MDTQNEFSVVLWFPDNSYLYERRGLDAQSAVELAKRCTERPAAIAGLIEKISITDGEDYTCFMWEYGKGVVFPELEKP